jgi:hypothetical protein
MVPNFIWIETIEIAEDPTYVNAILVDIDKLVAVIPVDDLTAFLQIDQSHFKVSNDSLHKVLTIIGKDYEEDVLPEEPTL